LVHTKFDIYVFIIINYLAYLTKRVMCAIAITLRLLVIVINISMHPWYDG
jgi:hypothetical protein